MESQNTSHPCPYCGEQIKVGAKKCRYCNEWLEEPPTGYIDSDWKEKSSHRTEQSGQTRQPRSVSTPTSQNSNVTVNYEVPSTNGVGTAGFILSLISLFLSWVPGVGWLMWFIGMFLSFIGIFKKPRGLAIVGFIISFIDVIILVSVVGAGVGILDSILG